MRSITYISIYLLFSSLMWSCNAPAESKSNRDFQAVEVTPVVARTPEVKTALPVSEVSELCKQLSEIKQFPGRDPSEQEDPVYAAILSRQKEIMPCLIEQISNEKPMHDPRQAPIWQHYKIGDTAVFLLAHMAKEPEILTEMLPPAYREEWKTNGVYAYFNYVSTTKNRRQLQKWWRAWLARRQRPSSETNSEL